MKDWIKGVRSFWNKQEHVGYLLVLPAMLVLFLFNIVPLFASFFVSALDINIFFTNIKFAGLENFKEVFGDSRFWNALVNTLKFTLMEVPVQIILAMCLAAAVTKNTWFNKIFRSIYFLPIICSATVVGIMWRMILNSNIGWVTYMLQQIGLPKISFWKDPRIALLTIVFMSVWRSFGISTIIFVAGMQDVPKELYESADMDGAGKIRQFFSITIPNIVPTIYFILITRIIGSMQVFDLVYVTTGGGPNFKTETLVTYIYTRAFGTDTRLGYATALAECLFVIILIISVLLYSRMLRDENN